jgi:hypothetical protein
MNLDDFLEQRRGRSARMHDESDTDAVRRTESRISHPDRSILKENALG